MFLLKRNNKIAIFGLLLAIIFTISGCAKEEKGLVAMVNGEGITEEEFLADYEVYRMISIQQYGEDAMTQADASGRTLEELIKEDIMEKLIIEKLIENEAKENGIEVKSEEVQEPLQEYITMLGGQEQFDEFLKTNNLTKKYFEENIKKELLYNKHREDFMKNTAIEDKETEEYFEEHKEDLARVRARHILLKTEEEGKEVLARLKEGEDFAKLAEELSSDKASAIEGGDLGYFGKGEFIAEFDDAAFDLEVGETSDLVKTEVGYHIIYLEDKMDDYDSLKDLIAETLKENKYYEKIQELRENAKVKTY